MTVYIALLRAVNVGGTGKLPMSELRDMCSRAGFASVRTYIASGNVVFESKLRAGAVRTALENALQEYAGKPVGVHLRTDAELAAILDANPYDGKEPGKTAVMFLHEAATPGLIEQARGRGKELLSCGKRELYVYYPDGMGRSRLKVPLAADATVRNMNTVAKLVSMAGGD